MVRWSQGAECARSALSLGYVAPGTVRSHGTVAMPQTEPTSPAYGDRPCIRQRFVKRPKGADEALLPASLFATPEPDDQVLAHVKRSVSIRLLQTKDEMKRLTIGALRRIQKLPELVKSFFGQPDCQYAAIDRPAAILQTYRCRDGEAGVVSLHHAPDHNESTRVFQAASFSAARACRPAASCRATSATRAPRCSAVRRSARGGTTSGLSSAFDCAAAPRKKP